MQILKTKTIIDVHPVLAKRGQSVIHSQSKPNRIAYTTEPGEQPDG